MTDTLQPQSPELGEANVTLEQLQQAGEALAHDLDAKGLSSVSIRDKKGFNAEVVTEGWPDRLRLTVGHDEQGKDIFILERGIYSPSRNGGYLYNLPPRHVTFEQSAEGKLETVTTVPNGMEDEEEPLNNRKDIDTLLQFFVTRPADVATDIKHQLEITAIDKGYEAKIQPDTTNKYRRGLGSIAGKLLKSKPKDTK